MKRTVKKMKNGMIVETIVYEKDDQESGTLKELFDTTFGSFNKIASMPKKETYEKE